MGEKIEFEIETAAIFNLTKHRTKHVGTYHYDRMAIAIAYNTESVVTLDLINNAISAEPARTTDGPFLVLDSVWPSRRVGSVAPRATEKWWLLTTIERGARLLRSSALLRLAATSRHYY